VKAERLHYQAYMLRLWLADREPICWRASLEDPRTGERLAFADLDELFAFLQATTAQVPEQVQRLSDTAIAVVPDPEEPIDG
jgi:hypothetical protein